MSSKRDPRRELEDDDAHSDGETSFAGVVDLGSMPPPASGQVDVHRAATAVSTMTDELMDEIRRARDEARLVESQKTRIQSKFAVPDDAVPGFTDETPTRPGKEKSPTARPEALVAPPLTPEPTVDVELPEAAFPSAAPAPSAAPSPYAAPLPLLTPQAMPRRRRALLPRLIFLLVTLAALVVSALALRRYRARLHR